MRKRSGQLPLQYCSSMQEAEGPLFGQGHTHCKVCILVRVDLPGQYSRKRNIVLCTEKFWHSSCPAGHQGADLGASQGQERAGETGADWAASPVCLLTAGQYHLQGWMTSQGCSRHHPRLQGDTGLGVVLRCCQRRGCRARGSAWQGSGWVSTCDRGALGPPTSLVLCRPALGDCCRCPGKSRGDRVTYSSSGPRGWGYAACRLKGASGQRGD